MKVVEVPETAILTAETSVAAAALTSFGMGGDAMSEEESPRLEREALVLAVMAEMSAGASSAFAPYLAALPTLRATHSPLAWSGAELAELAGTSALDHMMTVEDESLELPSMTAEHWRHVAKPFLATNPEFACHPLRGDGAEEEEEEADPDAGEAQKMYIHATALVAGFSFTLGGNDDEEDEDEDDEEAGGCGGGGNPEDDVNEDDAEDNEECGDGGGGGSTQAMVPFWDMLNHKEPAAASVRLNHDPESGMLQMIAVRHVPAGAEVFNTYGAAGDSELLRRYGFVMRRNPHGGGAEVGVRELMGAAATARFQAEASAEEAHDSLEHSDSDDGDDGEKPPAFSDSDLSEDEDEEEEESDDSNGGDVEGDDSDAKIDVGRGEMPRAEMLERLRWLRRRELLANSNERFLVSRTGCPSLALRHAARVLSMHPFHFRRLLAADKYERGDRDDQRGAYSDEEDEEDEEVEEDEDGFAGYQPLTVDQVWDGAVVDGEGLLFLHFLTHPSVFSCLPVRAGSWGCAHPTPATVALLLCFE